MPNISKKPAYNLKVVVQETGIKPDTLRAWERRYDLPQPGRSDGGHRLYSDHDIETLKWLQARQDEGLSISRAVDLWRSITAEEKDPLLEMPYKIPTPQSPPHLSGESLEKLRQGWYEHILDFNEAAAEQVLTMAFARYPLETVLTEVLVKGLVTIGDGWYSGLLNVQQEHFASSLVVRRLDALIAAAPPPTRKAQVIIGSPPGEEHTIINLMINLLLRQRGWGVVYLGANVPLAHTSTAIKKVRPQLVVLTAMRLNTAASLLQMIEYLHEYRTAVAYAGLVFQWRPDLRKRFTGHYLGDDLITAVNTLEQLLLNPQPAPKVKPPSAQMQQLAQQYQENQAAIETIMSQTAQVEGISPLQLNTANIHLQQNVYAALYLGDLDYLRPEIEWIQNMLHNYNISPHMLSQYLHVYLQAVEQVMGDEAAPLLNWLEGVLDGQPQ